MRQLWGAKAGVVLAILGAAMVVLSTSHAQEKPEDFKTVMARMKAAKPDIMKKHMTLLEQRYDLANRPAKASPCPAASRSRKACGSSCPRA